jgi:hypothetical protein
MSVKNNLYPHLLPDDIEVWEAFLEKYRGQFNRFDYDVRVGKGRDPGAGYSEEIRKMGIDLSQRRIDAVGYTNTDIWIIEVTASAGLKAVGQLVSYPVLYTDMFHPALPLVPFLCCGGIQSDILPILLQKGIAYEVFNVLS